MIADPPDCPGPIDGDDLVPVDGELVKRMHAGMSDDAKDVLAELLCHACKRRFTKAQMAEAVLQCAEFFVAVEREDSVEH